MKVVLFCGGLGLRLRDYSDKIPKPLVPIGNKPVLWHIMKYYAHFGHNDFVICLGYRGEDIKQYFLDYHLDPSQNFALARNAKSANVSYTTDDWRITFVDTGLASNIGQRLRLVREHVAGEPYFLANYSDTLTDLRLDNWLEFFTRQDKVASMLCVPPHLSLHSIELDVSGVVKGVSNIRKNFLINGGYFVFRQDIFDYIGRNEELVEEPFERLIRRKLLFGHAHEGFWSTMDTYKDWQQLEELHQTGCAPWEVWKPHYGEEQSHVHVDTFAIV